MSLFEILKINQLILENTSLYEVLADIVVEYSNPECIPNKKFLKRAEKILHEEHNIKPIDLYDYIYCGTNYIPGANYYSKLFNVHPKDIESKDYCICGHKNIKRNVFLIRKGDKNIENIITIGSCCKNRFVSIETRNKTCSRCYRSHRNIKDNYCNSCRIDRGIAKKYFYNIKYDDKEIFKTKFNGKWDTDMKLWYVLRNEWHIERTDSRIREMFHYPRIVEKPIKSPALKNE